MITKPSQHETDASGERLLREILEGTLKWVVNKVGRDYGIDATVQVFDGEHPSGAWFHVQLKSSTSPDYSTKGTFVSQELGIDHARHYATEMRDPVFLIYADVASHKLYWHAPQLDGHLKGVLSTTHAQFVTVRVPVAQQLPQTAPELLTTLNDIYMVLGNRTITSASASDFAESLTHFPDQEATYSAFQNKTDTLKIQRIVTLFHDKKYHEARIRADAVLIDPDSAIEVKFWAQMTLQSIDYAEILHAGKPQKELSGSVLLHAVKLQKVTKAGPKYLKFYSLITRRAAELEVLAHSEFTVFMALRAHIENRGNPMLALGLYARRSVLTRKILFKYNQCVRLARYAASYPDRWMLGRALANVPRALGPYMVTLRADNKIKVEKVFLESALRILKLAVWICQETGDSTGVVLAITSALSVVSSEDSELYRWAIQIAQSLVDKKGHDDALRLIARVTRRWKGETVEGDYEGDTIWQAIQNIATGLGIDISDENDPFVMALKIAAKDDSPERILARCEHLLVTQGATGPIARTIIMLFRTTRAASKVVHCTLHNFHVEGREQDQAYDEFRRRHCDACPDAMPRPKDWKLTSDEDLKLRVRHHDFVSRLIGTSFAPRFTNED
jgi:Domain of unknown function (DUF4365)